MEHEDKSMFDDFLNHIGLRRDTKLTLKDVNVIKVYSCSQEEKDDIVFQFFTQLQAEDRQVIHTLHTSVTSSQKNKGRFSQISKRDVLFAILNCCDPLLMQHVLYKLHTLGSAVPILMPSVDNGDVHYLQWGLRPCFQHHALLDSHPKISTYGFISASAVRFGDLNFSKSNVLNKLLAKLQKNDGSTCVTSYLEDYADQTVWSKGALEVTWYTSYQEVTMPSTTPFLLFNLRGDGHHYGRQQRFCTRISQIQIVFLSQYSDDNLKPILSMTETSDVILVTNNVEHKEIKAFQTEKLTVIHCKGLSSLRISEILLETLVEKIKSINRNFRSSLKDLTDACINFNFIDDEQKFQRAKCLAEELVDDIPYNVQGFKEQMLHFTKSSSNYTNLRDLVDDTFCRDKQDQCSHEATLVYVGKLLQCFTFSKYEQQIFLSYLQLYLQQKLSKTLQNYTDMYAAYYKTVKILPISTVKVEENMEMKRDMKICMTAGYLEEELKEISLKVEHFLFVTWHHLRSSHLKAGHYLNSSSYNECIKAWLLNGNSFELINFDACNMLSPWALRILYALQSLREGGTRARVVSVFGGDGAQTWSSLNRAFGTSFSRTDNLCSGGLQMQLIPIQNTSKSSVGFDYLVFLDVKAISLTEGILGSFSDMRKYLLLLMSSITDVLIINLNKDGLPEEESIMFDMIVHTVLKFKSSVVKKCCVIYHVTSSERRKLNDFKSHTQGILEKSCNKVHEREPSSSQQTYIEKSVLREKVLSCFTNEGTINVTIIPDVQSLSSYQDYVGHVNNIRMSILLLLQQCQRRACTLRELCQAIFIQSWNAPMKGNTSLCTPIHKFVHPSSKIHHYYVNSVEKSLQKISCATVTASTAIASADNKQEEYSRSKTDISELVHNEVDKVAKFLAFAGRNNVLTNECINLKAKLLKYKEAQLQYSFKELQQVFSVAEKNDAIDHVVRSRTREVLATMNKIQRDERESLSVEEHLENCIKEYINDMNNEYPQIPILEIKSKIKLQVIDELKRSKYGNHVHTLIDKTILDDWACSLESINSIDEVKKLEKKFNIEDKRVAKVFLECKQRLSELSTDYANFTIISEDVIRLLKCNFQFFQNTVDSLTMCIFLGIKFIFSIHRHHARADAKSRHLSPNEIYFENYIVKNVEPLRFPSLKSKLDYIVPLFATALPSDDYSDLAKILKSRSVTNYEHIPLNLLTIQRLDWHFLWFLPVTSSQNVNSILNTVNDAKLYCLGTALANSVYGFEEFFDNIFSLIKHSLINGRHSETIKAAAFIHVSAWSLALLSVKEYEKDITTNAANRAGKLVPILKLNILFVKQPLEKELAQTVCDAMEDTLLKRIQQEFQSKLRKFLLEGSCVIFLKRSFIGQMLRSFCDQDDFQQFLSFVEDYDHCSRKYILVFLVTKINDENYSFIWKLKAYVIKETIDSAIRAVKQATLHFIKDGNNSLYSWMQTFETYFVGLSDERLKYLEKQVKLSDADAFAEHCCSILGNMKQRLNDRIELPEKGNVDSTKTFLFSLPRQMHEEFSSNIIGCIEQCPLCGNVCEFDLVNHEYHSVLSHIPIGIKGGRDRESDELISLTCPSLVSKNDHFTSLDLEDDEISKLSTFMTNIHPTWHIQDAENGPHVFWKYIFNHFNRQFAEFYECREGKLPPDWKEYSKNDAIRSVERTYKLDQN